MSITETEPLPRWSVADVHEGLDARSFTDAMERIGAGAGRLVALFDQHDVRAIAPRPVTAADGCNTALDLSAQWNAIN